MTRFGVGDGLEDLTIFKHVCLARLHKRTEQDLRWEKLSLKEA